MKKLIILLFLLVSFIFADKFQIKILEQQAERTFKSRDSFGYETVLIAEEEKHTIKPGNAYLAEYVNYKKEELIIYDNKSSYLFIDQKKLAEKHQSLDNNYSWLWWGAGILILVLVL